MTAFEECNIFAFTSVDSSTASTVAYANLL
jgi:hypothetical protein